MIGNKILSQRLLLFSGALVAALIINSAPVLANNISTTTLMTAGLEGKGANDGGDFAAPNSLTPDGRITVFASQANNLVPGDTNIFHDIFTYDRITKKTELISKGSKGEAADDGSHMPSISADGRYIAYISKATNIVPGIKCSGHGHCANVLVYDRATKTTIMANRNTLGLRMGVSTDQVNGPIAAVISTNGQFVAFRSVSTIGPDDQNGTADVIIRDLKNNVTRLASVDNNGRTGDDYSEAFSLSGDGRYVVFSTYATLVPQDTDPDDNRADDVYLRDMQLGVTTLLSVTPSGGVSSNPYRVSDRPVISTNGRYVVFQSTADDLVPGDTNQEQDIFLRDVQAGKTQRVNVTNNGVQANSYSMEPSVSDDGKYILFASDANNLVRNDTNNDYDVFVHYRDTALTRRVSVVSHSARGGNGRNFHAAISGNGKAISFMSDASNLHPTPVEPYRGNLFLFYNPVVDIPYYDDGDLLDLPGFQI